MILPLSKSRTLSNGLTNEKWKRNVKLRITTWNITSLYRTGPGQNLANVLGEYEEEISVVQEFRWPEVDQ